MKTTNKLFQVIMLFALTIALPASLVSFTKPFMIVDTPKVFETWKTVTIGGCLSIDCYLCDTTITWGSTIYYDPTIEMLHSDGLLDAEKKELEIVKITPAELGFKIAPTYAELCKQAGQFGFAQCPGEVGPALRQLYRDQPVDNEIDNMLFIAMEPLHHSVFVLGNTTSTYIPGLAIGWSICDYESTCKLHQQFAFCKKK